jgi:hypothetical protein
MKNLWPEDLFEGYEETKAPVEILQQQASFLGEMTKNVLKGLIGQGESSYKDLPFLYEFYINAPTVGNYSYKLFSIVHDIDLYPVYLMVEKEMQKEILGEQYKAGILRIKYSDETTFAYGLGKVFRSTKTKKVINSLLQMTRGKLSPPPESEIPF